MHILHFSDTHNKHHLLKDLPKADIITYSGDMSFAGSENEVLDFLNWFCDLDYRHKIFIAGNHDFCLDGEQIEGLDDNCHYLYHSAVEIEGVKFYGIPMFIGDAISGNQDESIQKIPNDTDILITHQPPFEILDFAGNVHYGDSALLQKVLEIQPQYHLFGHIHDAYGITKNENTTFVNAAILNEKYEFANKPILLEM